MEQETDILIRELQQQKPAACQRLFKAYGPVVYRMVQRIVTCREDAEEVYQDVFVKALRGIGSFDSRQASLTTWLKSIAYHESLNFVRGKRATMVYIDESVFGANQLEDAADPHEQAVVSMFYYDNMSLADIAFVTGSVTSTVGSQLSRIRKKLYRMIKTNAEQ